MTQQIGNCWRFPQKMIVNICPLFLLGPGPGTCCVKKRKKLRNNFELHFFRSTSLGSMPLYLFTFILVLHWNYREFLSDLPLFMTQWRRRSESIFPLKSTRSLLGTSSRRPSSFAPLNDGRWLVLLRTLRSTDSVRRRTHRIRRTAASAGIPAAAGRRARPSPKGSLRSERFFFLRLPRASCRFNGTSSAGVGQKRFRIRGCIR